MTTVRDASARLAVILAGPGADRAREAFPEAAMSAINRHEVAAKLVERGRSDAKADALRDQLEIANDPHDAAEARAAAILPRPTRAAGLRLGDRAGLAPALILGAPVLTADRARARLDLGVAIEVIR